MRNLSFIVLLIVCAVLTACKSEKNNDPKANYSEARTKMEAEAQVRLATARKQLAESGYDAAKRTIKKMREDCYLALTAREEAILLMDSIDLWQARADLARVDSLMQAGVDTVGKAAFDEACRKVQFYERKIQFDKSKRRQ